MTTTPTIRQILSDSQVGLLPYLRELLQSENFSQFKVQLGFHVYETSTQVSPGEQVLELQTTLFITLKLAIVVDSQTNLDDALLNALEFQEVLDAELVKWSQHSSQLIQPIAEIKGTLSNLEEIPYHGGYLPGFELQRQFALTYNAVTALVMQDLATNERESALYSPGERTSISGQYEIINPDGKGTGIEITSTQNHPFPPTPKPNQSYKLVDPTKHKKRTGDY